MGISDFVPSEHDQLRSAHLILKALAMRSDGPIVVSQEDIDAVTDGTLEVYMNDDFTHHGKRVIIEYKPSEVEETDEERLAAEEIPVGVTEEEVPEQPSELVRELSAVLNRHGYERGSNTPDFIIAEYLVDCLNSWDAAVSKRERWWGDKNPKDGVGGSIQTVEPVNG